MSFCISMLKYHEDRDFKWLNIIVLYQIELCFNFYCDDLQTWLKNMQ